MNDFSDDLASPHFGGPERRTLARLVSAALEEDLGSLGDLTCETSIPEQHAGTVQIVSRQNGVLCGMASVGEVFRQLGERVRIEEHVADGARLEPGTVVATISGNLRLLLTGERTVLNLMSHLSGIATLTARFKSEVSGTSCRILDTRKTLPGWRALQKYAVRCGGGTNHRIGLYDGVIIKDNHVAAWREERPGDSLADLVRQVRATLPRPVEIEVEVDTLAQFDEVLPGKPDWVLLDNFSNANLTEAVSRRAAAGSKVGLEASGGVNLDTVRGIAETGVDRISVGALTHSVTALDLGFDWG